MGNQTEYNILRYSGEADCSHYDAAGKTTLGTHDDAAGKTILGKRRIEENPNMDDSLKHVHLSKLKKQKSGKSVNPDHSEVLNKIVGKKIVEKDNNRSEESNLIPELKKPTKPSAVRDFPPGCWRYISTVAPASYKCLPQKNFTPPVSDSAYYTSSNGRIVPSVRKEQYQLSASPETHTGGVKGSSQQHSNFKNHSSAKESVKFRGNLQPDCVNKDVARNKEDGFGKKEKKNMVYSNFKNHSGAKESVKFRGNFQPDCVNKDVARNKEDGFGKKEKKNMLYFRNREGDLQSDGVNKDSARNKEDGFGNREKKNMLSFRNRENENLQPCRPALKEPHYISQHSSQVKYKNLQHFQVRPKTENANQVAHMVKKEANPRHSTVKVQGLCSQHNTIGTNRVAPYKGVSTPKQLSSKNVRTRDPPIGTNRVAPYKCVSTPKKLSSKNVRTRDPPIGTIRVPPYKGVSTPKQLSSKNVRTRDPLYPHSLVTNTPKLPPSKSLTNAVLKIGESHARSKVKETVRLFQVVCRKLLQNHEAQVQDHALAGKCFRVDLKASKILRDNNLYVNTGKQIVGSVPGVEVGDQFHYRIELCIVGLHRQVQAGIDFLRQGNVTLATSIVASGGYEDDIDGGDVLIYTGHGGNNYSGDKRQYKHQKLERGNLALKNSIDRKTPVRVIRGYKQTNTGIHENRKGTVNVIYTYDGLYDVQTYWLDEGESGYSVFKFQLKRRHGQPERRHGQPELGLKAVQFIGREQKHRIREGLSVKDISGGKERKCICAVNTIDEESLPIFFYTTKVIYPYGCKPEPPKGCECKDGCLDPSKCFCASKNGGEFPFNHDGAIVFPKPIVYECGPSCKCRGTCHNRVSQHGVRYTLEVFKTDKRGWGVRSLESIPSGSFICEYTGNLLSDTEAEKCVGNDEYLFDIGRNCNSRDQSLWSDLSSLMPDIEASATSDMVEDGGFTIDAAQCGNVGRFVNHSCSPNLYAQNVLYDHDDRKLPHIMLFAAENIPPMRELCYHYNYSVDEVRDSDGNIKTKPCYCGSSQCTGRMY